jgi:hypothetical protein
MRKYFLFIGDGHPLQHVRTNIEILLGKVTSMGVARVQKGVNIKWAIRNSVIYSAHCLLHRTHIFFHDFNSSKSEIYLRYV